MPTPGADAPGSPLPIPRRPVLATLDACVLYPSYLRDFLLSTAYYGHLYAPRWSEAILAELNRNLIDAAAMKPEGANRLVATLRAAFPLAEVPRDGRLVSCSTNDEKDRHVVEAALIARAEVIVTHNLKHLPDADLGPLGLVAIDPDEFFPDVYRGFEQVLPTVLQRQLGHCRTHPVSVPELEAILEDAVPRTLALLDQM